MIKSFYKIAVLISIVSFAVFTSCENPANNGGNGGGNSGGNGGNGGSGGGGGEKKEISYIGKKAPKEQKYAGDIVFCDGSATPYNINLSLTREQKAKVIAVIFYAGTECSDNGKIRALGIGLHQCGTACWCDANANGYKTNIENIHCSDELQGIKDGSGNFSNIKRFFNQKGIPDDTAIESYYPAFYAAKNYGDNLHASTDIEYIENWYLPSAAEGWKIIENLQLIKNVCSICGVNDFDELKAFWTSSQNPDGEHEAQVASTQNFKEKHYIGKFIKWGPGNIVAIREF
ncbi:MAG: hypothetical protein ACI4LX_05430 [Treponema sp.]